MDYTIEEKAMFMREALKEAEIALANDEIPIGCVLVKDGQIIGRGHNAREELQRAVMHAEIMAIEKANQRENSWRLLDTTLFVTIEPCVMCSGAIGLARIPQVIYGATNQKFGGAGSLYDILTDERLNHRVEVETGIWKQNVQPSCRPSSAKVGNEKNKPSSQPRPKHKNKNRTFANRTNYDIIPIGATVLREAGQGRNPAALSEVNCVLFSIALDESSPRDAEES